MTKVIRSVFRFTVFRISIAISLLFSALIYFNATSVFDAVEMKTVDLRFFFRGPIQPSGDVAIALVDEKSITALGRWPWSRKIIARLIQALNEYGAGIIGFDVLFTDPEVTPELAELNALSELFIDLGLMNDSTQSQTFFDELMEAREVADNDALMAAAMEHRANVVLGMAFIPSHDKPEPVPPYLANAAFVSFENSDGLKEFAPPLYNGRILPLPALSRAAKTMGFVNSFTDQDGALRRETMTINHDGALFAPLGLRIAQAYLGIQSDNVTLHAGERITMGERVIPIDSRGFSLINYYGPNYTIPCYPAVDILHRRISPDKLRNKVVIVGGAAVGIADLWPTPFSPAFMGVEKQATIVENVLQDNFIQSPERLKYLNIGLVLFFGVLMASVLARARTAWAIPFSMVCFSAHSAVVQFAFANHRILLNFTCPALEILLIYTAVSAYRYLTEERDKRFLRETFRNYLAPELIEDMFKSKTMPELGGEAKTITAFFTDIEGFSAFSEKLTACQVVELLNEYLTAMTDILVAEKGTLDKYEGDAIVAFFGAPVDLPDHALRSCRVAIAMQNKLAELREKWRHERQLQEEPDRNTTNVPPEQWATGDKWPRLVYEMAMRIGINSGEIVVGNMGSSMRMNYTMMGDAVNLAARLEAAAKHYGVCTMVSEHTLNQEFTDANGVKKRIVDMVEARMIDNLAVVGRMEPVKVYELYAMKGHISDQDKQLMEIFYQGMEHYVTMEWDKAIAKFNESLKFERMSPSGATPSSVYIERCNRFKKDPPVGRGEKWDGVFRMAVK